MTFSLPNIISYLRIIIAPFFFIMIISDDPELVRLSVFLYILGAFSDYVDGWIARKYEAVTSFGKFIDPLADKFLTTAAFIAFVVLDIIPLWMALIVIVRDFGMTALRVYADQKNHQVITSYSAKVKTAMQMLFIGFILVLIYLLFSDLFSVSKNIINEILFSRLVWLSMLIVTTLTLWTAIEYVIKNKSLFAKENTKIINEKSD